MKQLRKFIVKIKVLIKFIFVKVKLFFMVIYKKLKLLLIDYWEIIFPNYKRMRKEAGIKEERIKKIEEEIKKIGKIYIIFRFIPIILIFIMLNTIRNVMRTNKFDSFLVLYANFNVWGIFIGAIGTLFLAKGFIKSKEQIALESAGCFGYNPHLQKALIYSRFGTLMGLLLIFISVLLHLFAFVFSLGM